MKRRCPNRAVLQTVSKTLFADYVDWLCGPSVWGMTCKDSHGRALSSPTLDNVLGYEYAIRKSVYKGLNKNVDFAAGLKLAQDDIRLLQLNFLSPVAMHPASTVTAPNVLASVPAILDHKRPWEDSAAGGEPAAPSKKAKKAAQNAQKEITRLKEELKKAQGAKGGAKGRKGKDKGKEKGKKGDKGREGGLPANILKLHEGKPICFAWNEARACNKSPCNFTHVCWFCGESDHKGPACPTPR